MLLTFLHFNYFWIGPALVVASLLWRYLRQSDYLAISTLFWLDRVRLRPSLLRRLPILLIILAVSFIVLGLMAPVLPYSEHEIASEGLDIAIVLDLSASMQEVMDKKPPVPGATRLKEVMTMEPDGKTRLDTTKDALKYFIQSRHEDRIALVVFSDNAYVVSPLTFDYEYLLQYLDMIDAKILEGEGMTAIGDGIALANNLLERQRTDPPRSQVITVFTDGEHNIGRDPVEVLAESAAAGIRFHVVGVDMEDKFKGNEPVKKLIDTVTAHGGRYFDANTESQLLDASTTISGLEKVRLVSKEYIRQVPVFHWFAIPAGLLILAVFALRSFGYFADYT